MYGGWVSKTIIVVTVLAQFVVSTYGIQGVDCYYKRGAHTSKVTEYWSVTSADFKAPGYWAYWDWNGISPCWRMISDMNLPPLCQYPCSKECLVKKECEYFHLSRSSNTCEWMRKLIDLNSVVSNSK